MIKLFPLMYSGGFLAAEDRIKEHMFEFPCTKEIKCDIFIRRLDVLSVFSA